MSRIRLVLHSSLCPDTSPAPLCRTIQAGLEHGLWWKPSLISRGLTQRPCGVTRCTYVHTCCQSVNAELFHGALGA